MEPLPTPVSPHSSAASEEKPSGKMLRLLVCSDSPEGGRHLCDGLQVCGDFSVEGVVVSSAETLAAALSKSSSALPDAVVVCHPLGFMALESLLQVLRQSSAELPVLVVTDALDNALAVEAMRAGANDVVPAGARPSRLALAIQRELMAAQSRRQRLQAREVAREAMAAQINAINRFRRLTEAIPECVWVLDLDEGRMSFVSSAYERIWGNSVQDLLDDRLDWLRHVHPEDQPRMKLSRNQAPQGGLDTDFRVVRAEGDIRWLHLTTFPIHDSTGRLQSIGGVAADITNFIRQRDELRAALAEQQHRSDVQRSILDALPANVALLDAAGVITEVNARWDRQVRDEGLTQYLPGVNYLSITETQLQRPHLDAARRQDMQRFLDEVRGLLAGGYETVTRVYPVRTSEGQRWFRINIAPMHTQTRRGAVVMHVEITESMLAEQRLLQLSQYDSLTMLPNRVLCRDRLTLALSIARRNQTGVAVCYLDLDRFKVVNETLGHQAGDQLLLEVTERVKGCIRDSDTLSRFGGDKFALVLPELNEQLNASMIAERILESLAAPFQVSGNELFVSASIGIALFPEDTQDEEALLRNAETAMYRAKDAGRNNYQFFTVEMNQQAMAALVLERDLRHAIENGEFLLHYQPKVSCRHGGIVGFEALLRWKHPRRGLVSPAEFIPMLEETGLIIPVGAWVLNTACRQAQTWRDAGLGSLNMAVNVSGKQMHQELCRTVQAALGSSGLPAECLELELTESYLMHDAENIISTLRDLKAMDIAISVDDFGTGYSSLAYLKRFPLDTLKVDRAFVKDITTDANDVIINRAIINLAHGFDLGVVAEGVETGEQLSLLIENDCDVIQGFYFSRPLPAEDATRLLTEGRRLEGIGS
mgnify:CR=1 FL=1